MVPGPESLISGSPSILLRPATADHKKCPKIVKHGVGTLRRVVRRRPDPYWTHEKFLGALGLSGRLYRPSDSIKIWIWGVPLFFTKILAYLGQISPFAPYLGSPDVPFLHVSLVRVRGALIYCKLPGFGVLGGHVSAKNRNDVAKIVLDF